MAQVEIYTTPTCPYCHAAKDLLNSKGVKYTEIKVVDPDARAAMTQRANGRRSVPQIFVGDTHVGGFDDMSAMDREGKFDPLLQA